jgi:hypothetical protein
MWVGNSNGIFASLGRIEAGHLAGVGTRHGIIRRVHERRGAGHDAWYQMPRLRTESPLAALLPPRPLSRDATNARSFPIVTMPGQTRYTVLRLVAGRGGGAAAVR